MFGLKTRGILPDGVIYLAPQHDYLARWEISPGLGIGVVYANIPGTNLQELAFADE